ncbi:MAG: maleylpyruvate isomerase N-terminal domain-containing protein [Dehalococcoidia bacterium]
MMTRTFAPWVEPVAERLREERAQVVAFARSQPAEAWSRPAPNEGWTCKDLLAHIGGGNDQMFQEVLRAVVAREQLDPAVLRPDTDAANRREVDARRGWPVEQVIAELESTGDEIQALLAGVREEDQGLRAEGSPITLGDFMRIVYKESHDIEHLAQLRKALGENKES